MSGNSSSNATNKRSRVTNTRFADVISVLHVDDEEIFLKATKIYLEEIGDGKLTVDSLVNPEQVLGKLREKRYDVIVADYRMNPIDGLELLKQLQDNNLTIPYIIFTGRGREEVAINSLNLGANRYIKKGMDTESQYGELFHAIREVVHHRGVRDALQESEERYRVIFNESPISLWEEDFSVVKRYFNDIRAQGVEDLRQYLDNNPHEVEKLAQMVKIINVNNSTLKMYKAKDKTEFQKDLSAFLVEEAACQFKEELVALFNGKTVYQNEFPGYRLTGEKIDIILRLSVIPGYEETLEKIIVSTIDITERKQAEEKLKGNEQRLSEAQHLAHLGNWEYDILSDKITWSDEVYRIYDIDPKADLTYDTLMQRLHPDDRDYHDKRTTEWLKNCGGSPYEYRIVRSDGETRYVFATGKVTCDDTGNPIRMFGVVQDITERKRTEEALRESEERFRLLGENVAVGLSIIQEDQLVYGNDSFYEIIGFPKEEILYVKISEFNKKHVHPEDLAFIQKQLQKKISDEKDGLIPRYQYRWFSGNNQLKWIEVNSKSIIFQGKTAILGAIIDITRQKQAENDLRLVNEELQNFTSFVAHDLKAPLRNIRTVTDWLLRDSADNLDEQGKDHLASLVKQTTHMDALIDGIYQYSKIDHIQKKIDQINLNEFLPEFIEVLSPLDDFEVTIQTEMPILSIDRTHITQIFSNLIDNAITYMDKPKGHITISYDDKKNFEQFSVMDNGPGIEERHFKRIFQIFQTLTPLDEAKGTGVGLAIVKKVVEMNGGKVWLESTVGKGSTFYFTLPKH